MMVASRPPATSKRQHQPMAQVTPSRKAEQAESTRSALVSVARQLFATRGYGETSIEEICREARVTRGALYHHFPTKRGLFAVVYEDMERELAEQIAAALAAEPWSNRHIELGCQAFLDACQDPAVRRIVLLDAPSVLGWEAWHEIDAKYGLGLLTAGLQSAMDSGFIETQPVGPLATLILGALNEAVHSIARADDPVLVREQMSEGLARLFEGLKPVARTSAP